jgi:hypothetical protein
MGVVKTRNAGISRNMAEYHGIWRNITEYAGIITEYGGILRNITIFSQNIPEHHNILRWQPEDGSHATVYKHGRLTTYFITKVMDLSHFDGK